MSPLNALIAQGFGAPQWDLQQAQSNALAIRAAQRQEQMVPEEMNWLRESRRMKREQFGWERDEAKIKEEKWAREKEKQPMKDEEEALKYFQSVGPMLNLKNYPQSREWMVKKNGFNPALLPDISDIITSAAERGVDPEEFFEAWKFNTLTTMGQRIDLLKKEKELKSLEKREEIRLSKENLKELEAFEAETGTLKAGRGTEQYQGRIDEWRKRKTSATTKTPEVNMPPEYDYAMVEKFGQKYMTPEGRAEAAKWAATDQGQSAINTWGTKVGQWKASNVYIGGTPEGGIVTIPSKGKPTPTVTPGPPGGITPKQLPEDYKKDVTAINQAEDLVKQLEDQWKGLKITDRTSAVTKFMAGKVGKNPAAKTYADAYEAFLGNLSRSIAAERGVLTNQDIERIRGAIARIGANPLSVDSKEEGERKWKLIKDVIVSARKRLDQRSRMTQANPTGEQGKTISDPLGIR